MLAASVGRFNGIAKLCVFQGRLQCRPAFVTFAPGAPYWTTRRAGQSPSKKRIVLNSMNVDETSRVAVVDDDRHIREMLELGLQREGFSVRTAADGQQALELVRSWQPAIIVLDVMLPKVDGFALLPMLREITHVPIIMLTAKAELSDKVLGLTSGADDYLVKPFAFEELIARLTANLRRPQLIDEDVYRWNRVALNMQTRQCRKGGAIVDLTQREFDLLAVFMREPRRVFGKEHLLELIWGHDFEGGSNIVETYISYLRAKLDAPNEPSFIRTVRGVGYSLIRNTT